MQARIPPLLGLWRSSAVILPKTGQDCRAFCKQKYPQYDVVGPRYIQSIIFSPLAIPHDPLKTHEYFDLKVESTRLPYLGRCIWFRCERRPTHVPIASLAFQDPRAADTVTMSFEETKLALNMQLRSMNTHGLRFEDVVELWRIIEEQSSNYSLFPLNCWWFASVIWETLTQVFPGEAPVITHDHLLKKVIKSVGPDTAQRTEDVTRMFLAKLGINAKKTSLGSVDPSPSESTLFLPSNYVPCSFAWVLGRPIFRLFTRRSSKSNSLPYSPTHAPMLPPLPFETAVAQMFRAC